MCHRVSLSYLISPYHTEFSKSWRLGDSKPLLSDILCLPFPFRRSRNPEGLSSLVCLLVRLEKRCALGPACSSSSKPPRPEQGHMSKKECRVIAANHASEAYPAGS